MYNKTIVLILCIIPFFLDAQIINREPLRAPDAFAFGNNTNHEILEFEDRFLLISSSSTGENYYTSEKEEIYWENFHFANDDFTLRNNQLFYLSERAIRETYCSGEWHEEKFAYLISTQDQGVSYDTLLTERDFYGSTVSANTQRFLKGEIYEGNDDILYWFPYATVFLENDRYYFPKAYISTNAGKNWSKFNNFYSQFENLSSGLPFLGDDSDTRLEGIIVMNNDTSLMVDGNSKFIYSNNPFFTDYEIKFAFEVGVDNRNFTSMEYNTKTDILYGISGDVIFKSTNKGRLFNRIAYTGDYRGKFGRFYCLQMDNVFSFHEEIEWDPIKTVELDVSVFDLNANKNYSVVNDSVYTAVVDGKSYITKDFGEVWTRIDIGDFHVPSSGTYLAHYFDFIGDEILFGFYNITNTAAENNRSYVSQGSSIDYLFLDGNQMYTKDSMLLHLEQQELKIIDEEIFAVADNLDEGTQNLFTSKDQGESWEEIFEMRVEDFFVNDKSIFILENNYLHRSDDKGISWDSISFLDILPEELNSFNPRSYSWDGLNVLLSSFGNHNLLSRDGGQSFTYFGFPSELNGDFELGNGKVYIVGDEGQIYEENNAGGFDTISESFDFLNNCNSTICRVDKFNATNGFLYVELLSQSTNGYTCQTATDRRFFISGDNGKNFHSCQELDLDKYKDGYFYFVDNGFWRMSINELHKLTADTIVTIDLCDENSILGQQFTTDTMLLEIREDSTILYDIKLFTSKSDTIDYNVCDNDSININGVYYKEKGIFLTDQIEFQSSSCDSILLYANISIDESYTSTILDTICIGDSLFIGNAYYSQEGTYLISDEINSFGCDSLAFLQLEIIETHHDTIEIVVDPGDVFNDVLINSDTTWTEFHQNEEGCENSTTIIASIITSTNNGQNFNNGIKLYPNPFSNILQMEFEEKPTLPIEIQIIDLNGKVVHIRNTESTFNIISFNLEQIPSGLYFVKIQIGEHIYVQKVNHI